MLVALSVRKLKPGAYDEFRKAWEPDEFPTVLQRAYHVRDVNDPDTVISFGFLEADASDLDAFREEVGEVEKRRQAAMADHVDALIVDGVYEVVEEVVPAGRQG
jgi:hypothetical protein